MKKLTRRFGGAMLAAALLLGGAPGKADALSINAFSDVTYSSTQEGRQSNNGFALGQLNFYLTEQVSDRIDVLADYVIESPGAGFVIDLERLQVGYAISNNTKVRAGRFHNLLGYWNLAFHHGAQLQTTVGRPFFLEFEDDNGVIPVHMVGLWWNTHRNTGAGRINFGLMAGNGASLTGDDSGDPAELNPDSGGDADNEKAVSANLSFRPAAVRGLEIGVSGQVGTIVVHNPVGAANGPGGIATTIESIDQTLLGFHLVYQKGGLELLSEFYQWQHDINVTTGTAPSPDDSTAYYVQAGYLIGEATTPYVRYETLDVKAGDPYFQAVGMTDGTARQKTITTVGARYDLNYRSALKAEVRFVDDEDTAAYDGSSEEIHLQWSFAF